MSRDDWLARLAARGPAAGPVLRRAAAVGLGWLVLMTVWGFGRAWHGGLAPVELAIGLTGGAVVTVLAWRRADRQRDVRHASTSSSSDTPST